MIRKVLLLVLLVLLAVGLFSSFTHGVSLKFFGNSIETSSYSTIVDKSKQFVSKRAELESKNNTDYKQALAKQQAEKSNFKVNKAAYDELANRASVEEIRQANQKEEYYLDYLWMKIGTYANTDDVKVKISPDYNKELIDFDVSGQYIAVINFIYDLENDKELAFNVDNIVMQGGSSDKVTKANFIVDNVKIITSEPKAN
jgi:hypothetical protein